MKRNLIQLMIIYGSLLFTASCQKKIDNPFTPVEERVAVGLLSNNAGHVQTRPFTGRIRGSFLCTPTSNAAVYNSVANATGNVTHLGIFSKVTNDVIDLSSSVVQGTFIMTSQSGEQIFGAYAGTFSFGSTPGTFSWVLNATITGGSGRFSGATGEFVFVANGIYVTIDGMVHGEYTETFDGTITY